MSKNEKEKEANKIPLKLKTDKVNSKVKTVKLGDLNLILPPDSLVEVGKSIVIKANRITTKTDHSDLTRVLTKAVSNCGEFDAILVSGGIDSSVIAAIAKRLGQNFDLISVGLDGSEDIKYARRLGEELKQEVSTVIIRDDDVKTTVVELKKLGLDTYNVILGIVEYLALVYAKKHGYTKVLSGIGSDELFFGFKKHRDLPKDKLKDFRDERLFYMPPTDLLRIKKLSDVFGIEILMPYLNDSVIEYALGLNINDMVDSLYDKDLLRQAGKNLGLSDVLSERKKKAMQYGSGIMKSLERLSKKNNIKNVGDFIKII